MVHTRWGLWSDENKTGTSKVGAISKAQKAQSFLNKPRMYSWKALKTLSRHPKCGFHAQYDWKITFPDWKQKNFEIFLKIFYWKKLRKRRIVPKNEKGDPLGFINILSVAKYQKIRRGDSFETLKIFEKKIRTVPKINWKGGPFGVESSGFVGYVKKVKKRKGGPFAVSLHWSNLAWVNLSVSVKSGTYAMSSVVWRKKN